MRMPGFCTVCRRPRQVKVTGSGVAMAVARGVVHGICSSCEETAEQERLARRQRR